MLNFIAAKKHAHDSQGESGIKNKAAEVAARVKQLGCTHILASGAVGSLREEFRLWRKATDPNDQPAPAASSQACRITAAADVRMHRRIGYLPENPYFYDYLTAREFLDYCAEIFGLPGSERKRRTADLLARVKLDEKRWDTQLRKYSKGMLQ